MKICNDAWLTLYEKNFDVSKYVYHYTNVDKAAMILSGDSLKFSKVTTMNDTLESKPKIVTNELSRALVARLIEHFKFTNNQYVQLLCFSTDHPLRNKTVDRITRYTDFSGRGFSFPRMWAQYASDNNGVCFVFNKEKLKELISNALGASLITCGNVTYINEYKKNIQINSDMATRLLSTLEGDIVTRSLNDVQFLRNNEDFVKYNYLSKLRDWEQEREYRFVAYGANDFFVPEISKAICGVVVGEQIKPHNERILQMFCRNRFEVKKIAFYYNGCQLENIYFEDEVES